MKLPMLAAALLVAACTDKSDDTGEAADEACQNGTIAVGDANNYSYVGTLDVPSVETAVADVEVCWGDLSQDLQCHDLDLDELDRLALVRFGSLSQEEVEAAISGNSLQQSDVSGYVEADLVDGDYCMWLSELSFFGTPVDIEEEYQHDGSTYLLMLAQGEVPGSGARALTFLDPTTGSDVTHVDWPEQCGLLDFSADIQSLDTVKVCAEGPWTLDWSGLSADGQGQSIDGIDIDHALLGFYEGQTTADLKAQFLDLELIATSKWEADLSAGDQLDLTTMTGDSGAFAGFDQSSEGTWVFALQCSRCANPAPVLATVLEPSDE